MVEGLPITARQSGSQIYGSSEHNNAPDALARSSPRGSAFNSRHPSPFVHHEAGREVGQSPLAYSRLSLESLGVSLHMTIPSDRRSRIDNRQEFGADRLYIESERNRYASRAIAFVVLLNGIAAIVLLALLAQNLTTKAFADAMMVFSSGAILGLTSAFIAYLNRTIRLESPEFTTWRRPLRWLAAAAAILAAACFFVGMNMARISIEDVFRSTTRPKTISPQPPEEPPVEPQTTEPPITEPQPVEPQTTEPPITEPQPVEPQTTEPQQF